MEKLQISDALLIQQYVEGNENALATLIQKHKSKVYGFIYSKTNDVDLSDDIFQDTFIKVIQKLKTSSYHEEGKFLSWVFRISHNLIIDFYRKSNRMPMNRDTDEYSVFSFLSDDSPNVEVKFLKEQSENDVVKLLKFLPQEQQEIIDLKLYKKMSFQEIADHLDVSVNTCLGRMRYAIKKMQKLVKEHDIFLVN
jgi:RNA polymerase sigma-70 factor (ECF subfamily)